MTAIFAEQALLPDGWHSDVRIDARPTAASPRSSPAPPPLAGDERHAIVLPGMPNLHSHAFQRGMAGLAEVRGPSADSFWTWREVMYRFALSMTPDAGRGGRRAALCRDAGGRLHARRRVPLPAPRPRRPALCQPRRDGRAHRGRGRRDRHRPDAAAGLLRPFRLSAARRRTTGQRRFINDLDRFARLLEKAASACRGLDGAVVGVAPHSLRAVTPEELAAVAAAGGGRADPHPRRRADEGGRGLPRLVRRAAGRMAARQCRGRPALVPDPRHPHDRGRDAAAWRGAARSPASARSPRPISATASSPRRRSSQPAAASASAPIPTC